ncbi:MAG TPA: ATP-binding protein [Rhizomicrobium sp.]
MNVPAPLPRILAGAVPRSTPVFLALLAVTVFLSSWACIALTLHAGRVSMIWISNAIVLACLLQHKRSVWLEIVGVAFLANFAADIMAGDVVFRASGLAAANAIEVLIIAWPLRWLGFDRNFSNNEVLLTFYGLVVAACGLSALMAAIILNISVGAPMWPTVGTWFGADALGMSLLVPFFMCVRLAAFQEMFSAEQRGLSLALLAAVFAVGGLCYAFPAWTPSFLYVPVLILLTFRRGFAGGALGLSVAVTLSFAFALTGHGSATLATHAVMARIAMIQLYYAVIGFTIILAGAALEERRKLERSLAVSAKRAEASREEAFLAKEVAEKASHAKSAFLANMSHELRTPLNAVLGFSEIIAAEMFGPVGDGRYRDYAGLINSAGNHLLDLIGDILDMSKIEAGKLELHRERVDIAGLVRECSELMAERAAGAGVALRSDLAQAPRAISADKRAVKQILLNLLSNAVKFTPKGGSVVLCVAGEGALCRFAVSDTGIGIPAGEMSRIGNPFVQLSNNSGQHAGTGLGLALVRGLADLHGGTFRIASTEGQGTTATVLLPIDPPVVSAVAA